MSAGIIFGKKQVQKALRELGCEPVESKKFKKSGSHTIWRTPWGHLFMAPDEGCGHWVIQEIIDMEVKGTEPKK